MKFLMATLLLIAVLAAVAGAMQTAPVIALASKICLVVSLLLFLVTLVASMAKNEVNHHKKTLAH